MQAKRTLVALGALTRSGEVTKIGRIMEQYPVESSYARMLVEAEDYSKTIRAKLAAIIGIQEVGGIVKGGTRYTGWHKYTKQTKSDLLAQYDVFLALPQMLPDEYEALGIIGKNVTKAEETMERLDRDLGLSDELLTPITGDEADQLMRCIVAGQIDQLWEIDESGRAVHIATKKQRELSSSSVVRNPKLIVGTPFDLQIPTRSGDLETLHLVQGVTVVQTDWLVDMNPDMFMARRGKVYYDPRTGTLSTRRLVRFAGKVLEGNGEPVVDNTPQNRRAFIDAFATWAYEQLERERRQLGKFHTKRIPPVPLRQLQQQVRSITGSVISLNELNSQQRAQMTSLARLHTHLGESFMAQVGTTYHSNASRQQHQGKKKRLGGHGGGWKPSHKRKYKRDDS